MVLLPFYALASVSSSTPRIGIQLTHHSSVAAIRAQLVPAIAPLAPHIPIAPPATADDLQLWEDREAVEGAEGDQGIRLVNSTDKTTVLKMGWPRWKRLFVR